MLVLCDRCELFDAEVYTVGGHMKSKCDVCGHAFVHGEQANHYRQKHQSTETGFFVAPRGRCSRCDGARMSPGQYSALCTSCIPGRFEESASPLFLEVGAKRYPAHYAANGAPAPTRIEKGAMLIEVLCFVSDGWHGPIRVYDDGSCSLPPGISVAQAVLLTAYCFAGAGHLDDKTNEQLAALLGEPSSRDPRKRPTRIEMGE